MGRGMERGRKRRGDSLKKLKNLRPIAAPLDREFWTAAGLGKLEESAKLKMTADRIGKGDYGQNWLQNRGGLR